MMNLKKPARVISNADIREIDISAPPGHRHLRTTIRLHDGEEIVLQEATVANLVRGFLSIKTHPSKKSVLLKGRLLSEGEKKEGFAEWQLLESDPS